MFKNSFTDKDNTNPKTNNSSLFSLKLINAGVGEIFINNDAEFKIDCIRISPVTADCIVNLKEKLDGTFEDVITEVNRSGATTTMVYQMGASLVSFKVPVKIMVTNNAGVETVFTVFIRFKEVDQNAS